MSSPLSTKALGFHTPIAVAASTLAAVALFNPLRVRIQRVVDRRFNRAHYDAEATVAAFTSRLRDAVDLDTVRSELLEVVNQAVEPAHASVWIRPEEVLSVSALPDRRRNSWFSLYDRDESERRCIPCLPETLLLFGFSAVAELFASSQT